MDYVSIKVRKDDYDFFKEISVKSGLPLIQLYRASAKVLKKEIKRNPKFVLNIGRE